MTMPRRQLPEPTPESAPYWEGAKAHELRIQFCTDCQKHFFYPRIFYPFSEYFIGPIGSR